MFMKNLTPSRLTISTVIFMLICTFSVYASDYNISFTASGVSTTIDYILVQNLTQGTTVTVPAGSSLDITAINQVLANDESLQIYPNPIQNKATVSYNSNGGGITQIIVFGVDGRSLVGMSKNLSIGLNHFELSLPKGAYTLQINENGKLHSAKILSQSNYAATIEFTGTEKVKLEKIKKIKATAVPMQYNYGDLLLFKASSGNYISILTDIITGNKTINFNFVECKDVDGNYYSTVTIGNQVWMAENLKSSKYRNNIAISDKTNLTTWGTSTTEAYSDYSTPNNNTTYGKLYNWYANTSINNLAPLGWHIPADADWTSLSDFLGGLNIAGNKLKETGNLHWATINTTATNETGFTALPGGSRSTDNTVYDIGSIGYWWSTSEGTTISNGWYRSLSNLNGTFTRGYYSKSGGMSVRCIMGDLPVLTTTSVSNITVSGFVSGGNITFDGNLPIISRGVCWSTNQNPTINDSKTSDGTGSDSFTSSISGLTDETTYYIRAYATNSFGTAYGTQLTVSTALPTISTSSVSAVTTTSATCGGTVGLVTGAAAITARGVCWSTNQNPTIADNITFDGTGIGIFTSSITRLNAEAIYYVRAYVTNSIGTTYGQQVSFSTRLPVINTTEITSINATSVNCGGNITDIGGSEVTSRGVCWSITSVPTISNSKTVDGSGSGTFTSTIIGISAETTYYIRAYATNSIGTAYGNVIAVKTLSFPTNGLVAWYPFNGNAIDESGNGNNGVNNGANLTSNRFNELNSAYDFDLNNAAFSKKNEQIYIPYNANLNSNTLSVSIWVYVRSYAWTGNSIKWTVPITRYQDGSWGVWGLSYDATSLTASVQGIDNTQLTSKYINPLQLNAWTNIIFTYDGSILNLYVNSVLKSQTAGIITLKNTICNSGITIGELNQNNGFWYFTDGKLDDIGIWNRALTQKEITNLYNFK